MGRILVVDDSATTILFLEAVLEEVGHVVLGVRRAGEIASLTGPVPNLMLLDLHLPGWSHDDVLAEARARWGEPFPVVIHSSYPEERIREAVDRVGALGGVAKGLGPDELEAALRPYLAASSSPAPDSST